MADQHPIISGTRAINATTTVSTSLIGRGLSAIQHKEAGLALPEQDARYRQARDIYDRITDYGWEFQFEFDTIPEQGKQIDKFEYIQLQPFFTLLQQLADVFAIFQRLADQMYGKAFFPLAVMYWGGQGISRNFKKSDYYSYLAFDWCFANRAVDDPETWMDLAFMYEFGLGVESDHDQAVFWGRKAVEYGNQRAQYLLGRIYDFGGGFVKQDVEQALFWYCKAANQGNVNAQYNLGRMYDCGGGAERDIDKALFWYLKAAEQGNAEAQFSLGRIYNHDIFKFWSKDSRFYAESFGNGIEEDNEQAIFWFRKAAEQGHLGAYEKL